MLADSVARAFTTGAVEGVTGPQSDSSFQALADSIARAFAEGGLSGLTGPQSDSLKILADSIAKAFTSGAVEGLTSPKSSAALKNLADSLARAFGEGAIMSLSSGRARDSLQATIDSLGMALTERVVALRDSLFPAGTRRSIDTIAANLAALTRPEEAERALSFIKSSAEEILITGIIGLVILATVVGFFFVRSRKNRQMFNVVSETIDELDAADREKVAKLIEEKATRTGIQPYLHKALQERRGEQEGASGASSSEDN